MNRLGVSARVDYDAIAAVYDQGPHREKGFDPVLREFLSERPRESATYILDVSCGTGAQLAANRREEPQLVCVGIDASLGMLRVARTRDAEIVWLRGDAAALPFRSDAFDYLSNQFAFHHIHGKRAFLAEAARVLRPGGWLAIRNLDPRSMCNWAIYHYFPAALERDLQDFMPVEEIVDLLALNGFIVLRVDRRHRRQPLPLRELAEDVHNRNGRSQLIALSNSDYEAGCSRLEADLMRGGTDLSILSEKCDVTITAEWRG